MDFLWISPTLLKWYLPLPLHCHYPQLMIDYQI